MADLLGSSSRAVLGMCPFQRARGGGQGPRAQGRSGGRGRRRRRRRRLRLRLRREGVRYVGEARERDRRFPAAMRAAACLERRGAPGPLQQLLQCARRAAGPVAGASDTALRNGQPPVKRTSLLGEGSECSERAGGPVPASPRWPPAGPHRPLGGVRSRGRTGWGGGRRRGGASPSRCALVGSRRCSTGRWLAAGFVVAVTGRICSWSTRRSAERIAVA